MTDQGPIPVTVIGGYLGAGKTTLLNHLLRHHLERRIAVLVNDFGAIDIDAQLIASHDGDTISLANGCICCSLAAGLHTVLTSLLERAPLPEQVIVEASGVANPYKVGQYGHMPGYRLDGVVVLVDVETIRVRARDKFVGKTIIRQLQGADLLVLTKTDLVTLKQAQSVRDWLQALVPDARMVTANHGALPLPVILGLHATPPTSPAERLASDLDHPLDYDTVTIRLTTQVTREVVHALVATFPDGVLRAKGLFWLAEERDRQHIFQLVGKRWSLKPGEPWGDQPPRTEVVFIGLPGSIDREHLVRLIASGSPLTAPLPFAGQTVESQVDGAPAAGRMTGRSEIEQVTTE